MKYREIKENINEGLKFYVTLQVSFFSLYSSKLFTVKACLDYATCPGWFFYSDFTLH